MKTELSREAFIWQELSASYSRSYECVISINEDDDSENNLYSVVFRTSNYGTTYTRFKLPYGLEKKVSIVSVYPYKDFWGRIYLDIKLKWRIE